MTALTIKELSRKECIRRNEQMIGRSNERKIDDKKRKKNAKIEIPSVSPGTKETTPSI